jgi:hypothetical protein
METPNAKGSGFIAEPAPTAAPTKAVAPVAQQAPVASPAASVPVKVVVQMLPNTEGAQWETVQYPWNAAVNSLGFSYDLRRINADTGEVIETRTKTPKSAADRPAPMQGATRANPNLEFERWWENNSQNEPTKEQERNAFLAGWFGRQQAR